MKNKWIQTLVAFFLAMTGTHISARQSHPCDAPAPSTLTVSSNTPLKVQFCARQADAPEAFTIYLNNVPSDLRPMTMTAPPNALGYALYEGAKDLQFAKGTTTLQISLWNKPYIGGASQEGAKSSPLTLSVVDNLPPAAAPKVLGLIR